MSDKHTRKRQPPISWRPPQGRRDEFLALADAKGLSPGALITASVFGENALPNARRSSLDKKLAAKMLGQLGAMLDELRRSGEIEADAYQSIARDITDIRNMLMGAIGRRR